MDYQIKNKIKQTDHYEELLEKVDKKIGKAILEYGGMLEQGQQSIEQLMGSLACACWKVQENRRYMATCVQRVNNSYSKIGPILRKINNIGKVIEIMAVWG